MKNQLPRNIWISNLKPFMRCLAWYRSEAMFRYYELGTAIECWNSQGLRHAFDIGAASYIGDSIELGEWS